MGRKMTPEKESIKRISKKIRERRENIISLSESANGLNGPTTDTQVEWINVWHGLLPYGVAASFKPGFKQSPEKFNNNHINTIYMCHGPRR